MKREDVALEAAKRFTRVDKGTAGYSVWLGGQIVSSGLSKLDALAEARVYISEYREIFLNILGERAVIEDRIQKWTPLGVEEEVDGLIQQLIQLFTI